MQKRETFKTQVIRNVAHTHTHTHTLTVPQAHTTRMCMQYYGVCARVTGYALHCKPSERIKTMQRGSKPKKCPRQ